MEKLSKVSASQVNKSLKVIEAFRKIDITMPIGQVAFFLNAAKNEGLTLGDIAAITNINMANASRYLANLTKIDRYKEQGLGLLDAYENPVNRRQKLIVLTDAGRKLINEIS